MAYSKLYREPILYIIIHFNNQFFNNEIRLEKIILLRLECRDTK